MKALSIVIAMLPASLFAAVAFFGGANSRITQLAQSAFIDYDPKSGVQTWVIQPTIAGRAGPFGIVIPVPARCAVDLAPKHFLDGLDVFTRLKDRRQPSSTIFGDDGQTLTDQESELPGVAAPKLGESFVPILETGVIPNNRGDLLYAWLRERGFEVDGRQPIIARYVLDNSFFVVATIDPYYMRAATDQVFNGRTQPIRIQFRSDRIIWPLHMNRIGVSKACDTTFYLQAPTKLDLPDDFTYQYMWVSMLRSSQGKFTTDRTQPQLPGGAQAWLDSVRELRGSIEKQATTFGFSFEPGKRPRANSDGFIPSSLQYSKRLTKVDLMLLEGKTQYSEPMPNVDAGLERLSDDDPGAVAAAFAEVNARIAKSHTFRPDGYLVREASKAEIATLPSLQKTLRAGACLTRIHKPFQIGEILGDIAFRRAGWGKLRDDSEYTELLPASPRN